MFDNLFDDVEDGEEDDFETPSLINEQNAQSLKSPRESTEMFGNNQTEQMLLSLFAQGTLPHALVFAGPQGVGKSTMAFRFARFLLKQGMETDVAQDGLFGDAAPAILPTSFDVDAQDPVFRRVASGGHADLRFIERPIDSKTGAKKGVLDVDTVREIAPFLRKTSAEGGWRVVIVDEADTMNRNSQNAILKILEEPPAKSLLILICNRLGSMLPTIRSRCRVFHFAPLAMPDISALLKRHDPSTSENDIRLIATIADGSMGRALNLMEEGGVNTLRTVLDFMEGWPRWDWAAIHPWADNLSRPDADKSYQTFTMVFEWICASFLKSCAVSAHILPEILKDQRLEALKNHYSLEQWVEICEKLNQHFINIENSNLDRRMGVLGAFSLLG